MEGMNTWNFHSNIVYSSRLDLFSQIQKYFVYFNTTDSLKTNIFISVKFHTAPKSLLSYWSKISGLEKLWYYIIDIIETE